MINKKDKLSMEIASKLTPEYRLKLMEYTTQVYIDAFDEGYTVATVDVNQYVYNKLFKNSKKRTIDYLKGK